MNKTYYHVILDKSGSMSDCQEQTITGFNEQIRNIRNLKEAHPEQEISLGLTLFNDDVSITTLDKDPYLSKLMDISTYVPGGSTALLDAIGWTVQKLEGLQVGSDAFIPPTFVIIILTDGYENCSRFFKLTDIRSSIKRLEATGQWTFSFLGATLDAVDMAEQMAIKRSNSMSFAKINMKGEVWDNLNESMSKYMLAKKEGQRPDDFLSK